MSASQLRRAAKAVRSVPNEWARSAVKDLTQAIKPSLSRDTGGDNRLSGTGGTLQIKSKVTGSSYVEAEVVAGPSRARGMWFWLEKGTGPKRPQGGNSPAKRTWSRSVDPVLPQIKDDAERRFSKAVRSG